MINWNEPKFGKRELELVNEVLESGYVSEGPKTKELEEKLAKIVGTKHVIMTTSCTMALKLAIEAIKKTNFEEEMFASVPSTTFLATRNALIDCGVKPLILDVDEKDYLLNNHSGNFMVAVNILGRSVDRRFIEDLQDNGFPVICDNAGALGSNVPIGDIACYSLQGNKIISCGQGGFCATDSDTYARLIRRIKDFGRTDKDDIEGEDLNYKFNDILAAVTLGQLESLEDRKKNLVSQYKKYRESLSNVGKFISFDLENGEIPLWVEFFPKYRRNDLFDYLKKKGINCRKPWEPLGVEPVAYQYYSNCLWLPNGPGVNDKDLELVISTIEEFYYGV